MFRRSHRLFAILPAGLLVGALVLPGSALAHEHRTIDGGKYNVVVGWDVEPAYQSLKNAASIRITLASATTDGGASPTATPMAAMTGSSMAGPADQPAPVTGADKTLRVQIRQGADVKEFPLRSVFGQPGYYVADIVPTRVGDYAWTFVGSLDGDQINEKFETADGKFNGVEPLADL